MSRISIARRRGARSRGRSYLVVGTKRTRGPKDYLRRRGAKVRQGQTGKVCGRSRKKGVPQGRRGRKSRARIA